SQKNARMQLSPPPRVRQPVKIAAKGQPAYADVEFAIWENEMRIILAAIALALAVACSNEGATPEAPAQVDEGGAVGAAVDVTAGEAKTIEEMQAESLAAVDQEACAAAGGAVRRE